MVLEGCNGEIVRAIEQCLAVDDARNNSRRSISSSESGSSSQIPTAIDSKITTGTLSGLNQQNLIGTIGPDNGGPGLGGPTSPAEFFRNLTSTQNAGRPILPTFPHYMVSHKIAQRYSWNIISYFSPRLHCSCPAYILD